MFGDSYRSESIQKVMVTHRNVRSEIDLPARVQIVTELEHFVDWFPATVGRERDPAIRAGGACGKQAPESAETGFWDLRDRWESRGRRRRPREGDMGYAGPLGWP